MYSKQLTIANFIIQLNFHPTNMKVYEKKFIEHIRAYIGNFEQVPGKHKVDFYIDFKWSDQTEFITKEKEKKYFIHFYTFIKANRITTYYQIGILQFEIVLRDIMQVLLSRNGGFMLHASAVSHNNKAHIFLGRSGAGKSTIVRLLGSRYNILADDSVIIKKEKNTYMLYQTPIIEKQERIVKSTKGYLLGHIFFLKKSNYFKIEEVKAIDVGYQKLVQQLFTTKNDFVRQMKYLIKLLSIKKEIHFLHFMKDENKMISFFSSLPT